MEKLAMVALGGALGAVLRWLGAGWVGRLTGEGWLGTAFVNVTGSFVMGVLAVLMMERMPGSWGRFAPFLMTGVLGGFTTFSAFSLDTLSLVERGRVGVAAAYVAGSVALSLLALFAGLRLARGLA
ncbi:MAG TPA: fluoride efflux transporter CrcB [Paracoccaceae bacterium]|nr:fluoride efflux transporter CrcB [Paracoccaceae bacterium]